ncbi:apolipoprotein N-acyltransferase [Corynebacterium freiburgense]|uniref:apolipoprotein N-acyltransferase n=1 Tax=Corynebacterium freiburgense TaxID=556548 RepID=UPI00040D226D|nr:apolipoprotein N-acyltransferase [Corynebacterium freiburgense]WJZ02600.1 Apolipoprotein N-acyltransferase [Corynebacterium freiburgense]
MILRLLLAAASGVFIYASTQPIGWWPAGIAGMGLLYLVLTQTSSKRQGAILGGAHGLALYLFMLPWIGEFVGPLPYIALAITESLYSILLGAVGVVLVRWRTLGPIAFALWFVAVEWLRSSWPFGGFAWARIAWGQIGGVLQWFAPIGGPALISAMVVVVGAGLALVLRGPRIVGAAYITIPLALGAMLGTDAGGAPIGETKVAAIQGNVPRLGLDFNAQRRAVLQNHIDETLRLTQPVDLVIWPENASDVNPFADPQARMGIDAAVRHVNAPLLVGTLTRDEVGPRNTMVVFDPDGTQGEWHHKKFLQPFGETMPLREFFRLFSSFVDKAGNFQPGNGTGVVHMGDVAVGIATCYEIAFDAAGRDAVLHGATILTSPTNNATFGFTDMTYQQLAMSRMRAIELDRAVVVAATSGVSAIIQPDGTVTQSTKIFESGTLVAELPLKETKTISARFGSIIEYTMGIIGALIASAALLQPHFRGARNARTVSKENDTP